MKFVPDHFKSLNHDVVVNIMSRLDGRSLAASASTSKDLHDTAQDKRLWQKLCHETWSSTSMVQIASPGFKSLYAEAFPLILYDPSQRLASTMITTFDHISSSPSDFKSLVDIYYKGHTIFSKVADSTGESIAFLSYPFKIDLLGKDDLDSLTKLPTSALTGGNEIVEEIRLSWIVLNTRKGKAVNISSWKPRWIQRCTYSEDYRLCFGSVIPVEDNVCECVIMVKCRLMIEQGCITWKEITLMIKDIDGSNLNGKDGITIMDHALTCSCSINHDRVNGGYQIFENNKILLKLKSEQEDKLANILCASIAIAALVGICYSCATLL